MKKKLTQALVMYFIDDYNQNMKRSYQRVNISRDQFYQMLFDASCTSISYLSYCCYGLYHHCWLDEYSEGLFNLSEEEVRSIIEDVFDGYIDTFNADGRVAMYEDANGIHILLLARDLRNMKKDIFIDLFGGKEG